MKPALASIERMAFVLFAVGFLTGCGNEKPSGVATQRLGVPLQQEFSFDLGNGVKIEFILVPAGEFMMGSDNGGMDEKPLHKVSISKPFYLGKCEVTQEQWETIMAENRSRFRGVNLPVEHVTWSACVKFMDALKSKWPGNVFRLPSEAEWEYACRAGATSTYSCGDSDTALGEYAWFDKNSNNTTHPVGQKKPNAWGLYDMHGNVFEWCADVYEPSYDSAPTNGTARTKGKENNRVIRGGAYESPTSKLRSAYRCWAYPPVRVRSIGLRVLLETP